MPRNFIFPQIDLVATGERIREVSAERGLTGQEIADCLYTTPQAVSKWRTGKSLPELENFGALLRLLDVSYEDIVRYKGEDKESSPSVLSIISKINLQRIYFFV